MNVINLEQGQGTNEFRKAFLEEEKGFSMSESSLSAEKDSDSTN